MSEPIQADPTAVILARMEVKLDNALTEQSRHTSRIDRLDALTTEHGNRITALETVDRTEERQHGQSVSSRAVFWTAVGGVVAFAALLITVLVMAKHGL